MIWNLNSIEGVNEDFLKVFVKMMVVCGSDIFEQLLKSSYHETTQPFTIPHNVISNIITCAKNGNMQKVKNIMKSLFRKS